MIYLAGYAYAQEENGCSCLGLTPDERFDLSQVRVTAQNFVFIFKL